MQTELLLALQEAAVRLRVIAKTQDREDQPHLAALYQSWADAADAVLVKADPEIFSLQAAE